MRPHLSISAVALALVAAQAVCHAQENPLPPVLQQPAPQQMQVQPPMHPPLVAPDPSLPPVSVPQPPVLENGFDQYRQQPDLGAPSSPGFGFRHFPFSMAMFTQWHRPKAATLTKSQRCAPDQFRPRGFGHLFARPCDSFRMDYNPHVLADSTSNYGPAYILRAPDPRCEDCDHGHAVRR